MASVLNLHISPKSPHFFRFASVWFEASESARQFSHRFSSAAKLGQIEGGFRLETKPLRVATADVPVELTEGGPRVGLSVSSASGCQPQGEQNGIVPE